MLWVSGNRNCRNFEKKQHGNLETARDIQDLNTHGINSVEKIKPTTPDTPYPILTIHYFYMYWGLVECMRFSG